MSVYDKMNSIIESGDKVVEVYVAVVLAEAEKRLRDNWENVIDSMMLERFGIEVSTYWNEAAEEFVTSRVDGWKLSPKERVYLEGIQAGYAAAIEGLAIGGDEWTAV